VAFSPVLDWNVITATAGKSDKGAEMITYYYINFQTCFALLKNNPQFAVSSASTKLGLK
jgi:hypothetical protein